MIPEDFINKHPEFTTSFGNGSNDSTKFLSSYFKESSTQSINGEYGNGVVREIFENNNIPFPNVPIGGLVPLAAGGIEGIADIIEKSLSQGETESTADNQAEIKGIPSIDNALNHPIIALHNKSKENG